MKLMHRILIAAVCLSLIIPLILLASGCSNKIDVSEDEPLYKNTVALLEAIVKDDRDSALVLLPSDSGGLLYDAAKNTLGDSSKLVRVTVNLAEGGSLDGREFRAVELLVETDTDSFYVESMVYNDNTALIPDFDVERIPRVVENVGAQTVFVILGCLSAAFALWMFIDCAVRCKEKKWLWLILIAVGMFSVTVGSSTVSSGIGIAFGWTNLSAITFLDDGTFHLSLMIPVAALAWLALRGKAAAPTKETSDKDESVGGEATEAVPDAPSNGEE